nr:unnamed protein product [Spirometra erinaceieuropaei]
MVDASNVAVGAVLQQSLQDSTVQLAFFSKKLSKAETRYSTFGRELLAAYLTVRYFWHLLEGCTRIRTTAYHPASNGMVERFHRQLKASLRAAADLENWTDSLPLVPLGICCALKPDLDCSAAELVFGSTVRLTGEMISPTPQGAVEDLTNLLHRLRQFMRTLSSVPPRSSASPSYLEKDLATGSHVFLRCD